MKKRTQKKEKQRKKKDNRRVAFFLDQTFDFAGDKGRVGGCGRGGEIYEYVLFGWMGFLFLFVSSWEGEKKIGFGWCGRRGGGRGEGREGARGAGIFGR
ncbi:MAG: hypothetical protein Pars93KO_28560 [Parasphingorhabdus sp.]